MGSLRTPPSSLLPLCLLIGISGCTNEVDMTPLTAAADAGSIDGSLGGVSADATLGIGLPCTSDGDCASGTCIQNFPGGYCSIKGCAPATGSGCPSDAVCRGGGGVMNTLCFERCPPSGSCREGYGKVVDGGRRVCCGLTGGDGTGFCAPSAAPACT